MRNSQARCVGSTPLIGSGAMAKICAIRPISDRKHIAGALSHAERLLYCDHVDGSGKELFQMVLSGTLKASWPSTVFISTCSMEALYAWRSGIDIIQVRQTEGLFERDAAAIPIGRAGITA